MERREEEVEKISVEERMSVPETERRLPACSIGEEKDSEELSRVRCAVSQTRIKETPVGCAFSVNAILETRLSPSTTSIIPV